MIDLPRADDRHERAAEVAGCSLVVGLAGGLVAAVAAMSLGVTTGAWLVVPVLFGATLVALLFWRGELHVARRVVGTVAALILLVIISGVVAGRTSDTSVDGRHYHAEGVWAIASGWNPVRDGPTPHAADEAEDRVNSFPKGISILEAAAVDLGTNIAGAKMFGILLACAAALISFSTLRALGIRGAYAALLAVALALNPVATAQFSTKMVDGVLASLEITSVMAAMLLAVRARGRSVVGLTLVATILLLVNTKYTGVTFVLLAVLPIGCFAVWRYSPRAHDLRTFVLVIAGSMAIAVLLIGWNPYVTNTIRHSNPMYYAVGEDSSDPAKGLDVGRLHDADEAERRALSLLSASTNTVGRVQVRPPLLVGASEWSAFRSPDVSIGGFGPLFSGGLIGGVAVAAVGFALTRWSARPPAWLLLTAAAAFISLTWVLTPAAWIARLAPQFWTVPLLLVAALLVDGVARRGVRAAALVVVVLLVANALGVAGSAAVWNRRDTAREAASLRRLRSLRGPLETHFTDYRIAEERRLRSAGIRIRTADELRCPRPFLLNAIGELRRASRRSDVDVGGVVALCPSVGP